MSDEAQKGAKKAAPKAKAAEGGASDAKKAPAKKAVAKKADTAPAAEAKPAKAAAKKADVKREKKTDTGIKKQGKLIDHIRLYDVIERPIVTEKSTAAAEQNKVVFAINPTATKKDVKDAVEALFQVKVTKVNTVLTKGKAKKFRGRNGQRSDQRKAIVTLAQGHMIDLTVGLK